MEGQSTVARHGSRNTTHAAAVRQLAGPPRSDGRVRTARERHGVSAARRSRRLPVFLPDGERPTKQIAKRPRSCQGHGGETRQLATAKNRGLDETTDACSCGTTRSTCHDTTGEQGSVRRLASVAAQGQQLGNVFSRYKMRIISRCAQVLVEQETATLETKSLKKASQNVTVR